MVKSESELSWINCMMERSFGVFCWKVGGGIQETGRRGLKGLTAQEVAAQKSVGETGFPAGRLAGTGPPKVLPGRAWADEAHRIGCLGKFLKAVRPDVPGRRGFR